MTFLYWREIKQKGEVVKIPKIRTLKPNSSSTLTANLTITGKYEHRDEDFISPFHKWMRKYWIDELPQLYSLFRGDLKIIGIRAKEPKINSQYSDIFRKKLEDEVKFGLIDITYSLRRKRDFSNPKTLEALYRLYSKKHTEKPLRTDLEFLCGFGRNVLKGRFSE